MECEQCGGLVTWRGPLSALTHTECENCGGMNCQVAQPPDKSDDEAPPAFLVGYSIMRGGWCVYVHSDAADYEMLSGPFDGREKAEAALAKMMWRSDTHNV